MRLLEIIASAFVLGARFMYFGIALLVIGLTVAMLKAEQTCQDSLHEAISNLYTNNGKLERAMQVCENTGKVARGVSSALTGISTK